MTPEQAAFMDSMFKFKIGDVLRHRATKPKLVRGLFFVVARIANQIDGSIEICYRVRPIAKDGDCGVGYIDACEHEFEKED